MAEISSPLEPVALIVGGGLAGSLLTLLLAKQGFKVEVFERRPQEDRSVGRSINLSVSSRALRCLHAAGVTDEELRSMTVPLNGRCIHPVEGEVAFQRYGSVKDFNLSIDRGALNRMLLARCKKYPHVNVRYGVRVLRVDIMNPSVEIMAADATTSVVRGAFVVGADGSGSLVRYTLSKAPQPRLHTSQAVVETAYKELTVPAGVALPAPVAAATSETKHTHAASGEVTHEHTASYLLPHPNWLHIWPRGSFMMIALANCDGTYTATLFMPYAQLVKLGDLTIDEATAWFKKTFPDASKIMPDAGREIAGTMVGPLVDVRVDRMAFGGAVALIGDAAHAMVPFYGQGMNCAMEDSVQLADSLAAEMEAAGVRPSKGGAPLTRAVLAKAFSDYESKRLEAGHAIQDLSMQNYIEMSKKTASRWFHAEMKLHNWLHSMLGEKFVPLYRMVAYRPHISYHEAKVRSGEGGLGGWIVVMVVDGESLLCESLAGELFRQCAASAWVAVCDVLTRILLHYRAQRQTFIVRVAVAAVAAGAFAAALFGASKTPVVRDALNRVRTSMAV